MLDRGESLNWFASTEIMIEALLAALFFYLFISHMLTSKQPFLDPIMFKDINFVSGLIIMFFVGVILLAVMALLPPFMQSLLGYPVLDVGILLAPRGLGTMLGMMVMGRLVNRYDPRIYVVMGFIFLSISLWQMTKFTAEIGAGPIILSGIVQGLGLGCIFVPLSTLAFATLPPHFRNEATPLYNLVRNLGSSIGVSVVITLLSQNTQINHAAFASYITPYSYALRESVEKGIVNLQSTEGLMAINMALTREGLLLAYLQDFRMMMWVSVIMIPLIFFIKVPKQTLN